MKQGKMMRRPRLRRFLIAVLAFSLVFAVPWTSVFAATNWLEDVGLGNNGKYTNRWSSLAEAQAEAARIHEEIASEGIVLLKNDGALPMVNSKRVTAFNVPATMQTALNSNGFTVNPSSTTAVLAANANYTAAQVNSFKSYNDAAIIYFARGGGESYDLSVGNDGRGGTASAANGSGFDNGYGAHTGYNGYGPVLYDDEGNETWPDGEPYGWNHKGLAPADAQILMSNLDATQRTAPVRHELQLTLSEERMVQTAKSQGFKEIIILVNTSHVMEMANLDRDPDIGAILWVGRQVSGTNASGRNALAKIISGVYNPSGRTINEWYRDFSADPTWQNFGLNTQTDSGDMYTYPDGTATGTYGIGLMGSAGAYGLDYEEGIYLGYKYYETYWAETAKGNTQLAADALAADPYADLQAVADQWWKDNVVYPLGYGLSYTDFSYKIQGVFTDKGLKNNITGQTLSGSLFASDEGSPAQIKKLYIPVSVRNNGGIAGKEVVQIYVSAPYTAGGIEKSYVTLCGYTKSRVILPGMTHTVIVEVNVQDFSSFDYNDANGNGNTGFELDAGEYVIHAMSTSHVDPENLNYDSKAIALADTANLRLDDFTDNLVEPLFSDPDSQYYTIRDNAGAMQVNADPNDKMTVLSRADLDGTFPKSPTYGDLTASNYYLDEVLRGSMAYQAGGSRARSAMGLNKIDDPANPGTQIEQGPSYDYKDKPGDPWYKTNAELDALTASWTQSNTTGVRPAISADRSDWLDTMTGVPMYVDGDINPLWTEYMNKLNYDEMRALVSQGSFKTAAIPYIGKRVTRDADSPINGAGGYNWGDCNIITATYNVELARKQGLIIAEQGMLMSTLTTGWYGPGVNNHRSPFSGRCAEYYGQDGFQSGVIAAGVVSACEEAGFNCYIKHTFMNDQETYRCPMGISTWATEQAIRECYGVTTQKAMQEGHASATMTAFNGIGAFDGPANYNLTTGLFREQWGWAGICVTDMYSAYNIAAYNVPASPARKYDAHFVDSFTPNPSGAYTLSYDTYTLQVDAAISITTGEPILDINNLPAFTFDEVTHEFSPVRVQTVTAYDRTKNWLSSTASINEYSANISVSCAHVDLMVRTGNDTPLGDQSLTTGTSASGRWNADLRGGLGGVFLASEGSTAASPMTVSGYHQYYYVRTTAMRILYFAANSFAQMNGFFANSTYDGWTNTTSTRLEIAGLTQGIAMANTDVSIPSATLNGSTAAYSVTSGTLPAGLTLNASTGVISGTPSGRTTGNTDITVTARVDGWLTAVKYLRIAPIENSFVNTPEGAAEVGVAYASTAAVSDTLANAGSGTRAYTIAGGALPAGLSIASATGEITGTPTALGAYNFTVQYQRGTGNTAVSQQFTITVGGFIHDHSLISGFEIIDGDLFVTYIDGCAENLGRVTGKSAYELAVDAGFTGTQEEWLVSLVGETGKGIADIQKTGTDGNLDIYTITYTDETTVTFTVTNGVDGPMGPTGATGNGIYSIVRTGTDGNVDTYTVTYTDGTTFTFTVTNGKNGENGKSAYQLAVEQGYTGTLTQWLQSLVGKDGKGIASVAKTGTAGNLDTYTITYTDNTTSTFTVANGVNGNDGAAGKGIVSIAKTGASGNIDTYTITYTDGTTSTFTVANGANGKSAYELAVQEGYTGTLTQWLQSLVGATGATGKGIAKIEKTGTVGNLDVYVITYTDSTTFTFTVTNGVDGIDGTNGVSGKGIASIAKTGTSGNTDTYTITYTDSTTTTFTVTNGTNGTNGKSAYELAVEQGYTGTVTQWLQSLAGATGAAGKGVAKIEKTGTTGNLDAYAITYTDGSTFNFTVTNGVSGTNGTDGAAGKGIVSIAKTGTSGKVDTYTITYTDSTTTTFTVTNGSDGEKASGCGSSSASIIALFSLLACAFVIVIKKQF